MKKHNLATRLWHWVNLLALAILFMSGLNISNAHRRLYWGDAGFAPEEAWLHVFRFPGWATIPEYYSLAQARQWHLLFAWVFAVGLLLYMLASLFNRHFARDIVTRRKEWRWSAIRDDVKAHLRFDFHHREGKYNFLQKLANPNPDFFSYTMSKHALAGTVPMMAMAANPARSLPATTRTRPRPKPRTG